MAVDLIEAGRRRPLVGVLGALRALPDIVSHILHGESPPAAPAQLRLHDLPAHPAASGGWVLLGERPEQEIALGLVGKFWRPVIEYAEVPAADFRAFSTPGFARTIYALSVTRIDDARRCSPAMRTATTSDDTRRWFHRYWTPASPAYSTLIRDIADASRHPPRRLWR
jgi:hypothetical protein